MGRWTLGTVQGKGRKLADGLEAVELPVDDELEVDEGAQAQLDAVRTAIVALAEAVGGEVHVTANGYAAKGGKRAGELPTSFLTIGVSAVDTKTGAPRTWVPATPEQQAAEQARDAAAAERVSGPSAGTTSSSGAASSSSNQAATS